MPTRPDAGLPPMTPGELEGSDTYERAPGQGPGAGVVRGIGITLVALLVIWWLA